MSKIKTTHARPLPHYPSPKGDNQRLLNYQYEYKIKGDTAALDRMYKLGCKIAGRFIKMEAYHEFTNMITGDMERFIESVIKTVEKNI